MSVEYRSYEQKLQETRLERQPEAKQVERLSSILAQKVASDKVKERPDRTA
jgi:hypothetical protein